MEYCAVGCKLVRDSPQIALEFGADRPAQGSPKPLPLRVGFCGLNVAIEFEEYSILNTLEAFMYLSTNKPVRELVLEVPAATRVFEKMGIDYCCGGKRSLADACDIAGVKFEDMELELIAASHTNREELNFQGSNAGRSD